MIGGLLPGLIRDAQLAVSQDDRAQAHRESGPAHFDAADAVTLQTLRYLQPQLTYLPCSGPYHWRACPVTAAMHSKS